MNVRFARHLTPRDAKQHVLHAFVLPADASALRIRLWHSEGQVGDLANMLTLTLFDPNGFRGAGHRMGDVDGDGRAHAVEIDASHATPGYIAGALPAGEWMVVIDAHRISADPSPYRLDIEMVTDAPVASTVLATEETRVTTAIAKHPGWYRGELHAHTMHSDGRYTIDELIAWAREHTLDFMTLSDHNTTAPLPEFERAARDAGVLPIPAQELTTFYGHALALGLRGWVDWRVHGEARTMPMIAAEVTAAGGLFVVAHPEAIGDPSCTGCHWLYDDVRPGVARIVEVWNGGAWSDTDSNNELALALFYAWLNAGHRLVATAGTDLHGPLGDDVRPGFNVVYAEALSEPAVLAGIRCGHLYLSAGPTLTLEARDIASGQVAMMGDVLSAKQVVVIASWSGCEPDDHARLICDGRVVHDIQADARGEFSAELDAGAAHWCALELRRGADLIALSNPIFLRAG